MKKLQLSIIAMLFVLCSYAQELPEIIPPSPEASALSKFTDIPVSHYTGLPNISIPIYTIQTKGITIPIGLNYHARGVQVSEIAPRTGLGWSLSYGGSISRQIRGKADDASSFGYLGNGERTKNYSSSESVRDQVVQLETNYPDYDYFPDQFSYTAGQLGGKFVLDYNDGKAIAQKYGEVEITYTREYPNRPSGKIESFVITDTQGNIYYYGKSKDGTRIANDYSSAIKSITVNELREVRETSSGDEERLYNSWHLMDIETAYGELISFYYEKEDSVVYNKSSDNATFINAIVGVTSNISKSMTTQYQLSRIESDKEVITFDKETILRQDYNGYVLDKISVFEKNDTNLSIPIKTYNLNYQYTTNTIEDNILWYLNAIDEKADKRLFLSEIKQENKTGEALPPHTFEYSPVVLPNRFSTSQDVWGYYNGASNGEFLTFYNSEGISKDRRVHVEKSEAGILKKITYPTGGTTEFTYEHNRGLPPSHFSNLTTLPVNPKEIDEVEIILTKDDFTFNSATGSYEIVTLQIPKTHVFYEISCSTLRDVNDTTTPDCIFNFGIKGESDISVGPLTVGNEYSFSSCYNGGAESFEFYLIPQGLTNSSGQLLHLLDAYDFQIKIRYDIPNEVNLLYSSGKRIKTITNTSENNTTVKEYEYTIPGTTNTSGNVIGIPVYYDLQYATDFYSDPCITQGKFHGSGTSFSTYQANSIGYSHVTEYNGDLTTNKGKTEYSFTFIEDGGGDYYNFPYHPPTDNEWLRGKNLNTKIYNNTNDNFSIVKDITNTYLYGDNINSAIGSTGLVSPNFIFTPFSGAVDWDDSASFPQDYERGNVFFKLPLYITSYCPIGDLICVNDPYQSYRFYHLTGGTQDLLSTTETDYFASGDIKKETNYFYDYDNHYQVKGTETIVNNGDVYKATNYYPVDKDAIVNPVLSTEALTAANNLLAENRIAVLQNQTHKNGVILSTVRNNYNTFSNGFTLPETIQTSKAKLALDERIVYHSYDDKGNPVEVSKKDGTKIYYVWGYNQSQPIAKIEGYDTLEAGTAGKIIINVAVNLSNADNDTTIGSLGNEGALRAKLQELREALPEAQVTTFTYDPLIGVTSISDVQGETMYYVYDSFNRLEFIKDKDGNILKENQYNYKN